jgi:hypothetical protein
MFRTKPGRERPVPGHHTAPKCLERPARGADEAHHDGTSLIRGLVWPQSIGDCGERPQGNNSGWSGVTFGQARSLDAGLLSGGGESGHLSPSAATRASG